MREGGRGFFMKKPLAPSLKSIFFIRRTMFSFGWFSSGRDQAAIDLFDAVMDRMATGFIPGRLAYVFCDRAPGETEASDRFQAAVQARGVPLVTQSSQGIARPHQGAGAGTGRLARRV